jgi:hypothetical protein
MALLLEYLQREGDVAGGERAAVVKRDAGPHQETIGEPVRRYLHGTRCQAVLGIGFIRSTDHQAREGELHTLRAVALENEAVKGIEREEVLIEGPGRTDMGEYAAFRRIRIDVVEMLEIRRVFEVAEGRHAVALGAFLRIGRPHHHRCERARSKKERIAARHIAAIGHWRVPVLAAFSASHHQTVGNAAAPYFGSGSGRPKRSQRAVRLLSLVNCGTT